MVTPIGHIQNSKSNANKLKVFTALYRTLIVLKSKTIAVAAERCLGDKKRNGGEISQRALNKS
jgi:hypothetical protein